jgi:serine/threonine protein kinase
VLELIEGCDLAHLARNVFSTGRPFPLPDAVAIVQAVATALHHAHDLRDDAGRRIGLVHRDVSPHNVVLSIHGEIKIIDFGVAKTTRVQRDTGAGLIKGKMGYHAPEQLRGDPIDARSDVFGLGVVLAELVIGRRLHPSDESLAELLAPRVPPVLELRPDCPSELAAVISMALSAKASGRFTSARAMATALAEVQLVLAREGRVPGVARPERRPSAAAGLGVGSGRRADDAARASASPGLTHPDPDVARRPSLAAPALSGFAPQRAASTTVWSPAPLQLTSTVPFTGSRFSSTTLPSQVIEKAAAKSSGSGT